MSSPLSLILFGGCLVHWPLRNVEAEGTVLLPHYRAIPQIHSFGEMFQIVDILRGRTTVPPEWQPLTRISPALAPAPSAEDFGDVDLALIEPGSPVELQFRGVSINRGGILNFVLKPVRELGRDANKIAASWFRVGLIGLNRAVRAEAEPKLLELIGRDSPEAELRRAAILETEATPSDIGAGFRKMQDLLGCPIGVVPYIFRYMPDGRPINWNAGFLEETLKTARELELPVFDPVPVVSTYGVQRALKPDGTHYTDEFLPIIARELVGFLRSVYAKSRMPPAQPGPAGGPYDDLDSAGPISGTNERSLS
jgi:hypothetical protein